MKPIVIQNSENYQHHETQGESELKPSENKKKDYEFAGGPTVKDFDRET